MEANGLKDQNDLTDIEILALLKVDSEALSIVYKRHKKYCINFMKNMYNDFDAIQDIYQDAVIVLYENAQKPDFKLSCTIQTYLNSICRNQILKRINFDNKYHVKKTEEDNDEHEVFIESINDWFEEVKGVNEVRVKVMKNILEEMKDIGSKCYEMLVMFFYQNKTMEAIAQAMNYTNADNAKSQKYKCQEKFKTEVFKRLPK